MTCRFKCNRCNKRKVATSFYENDRTCKECRKALVRANRLKRAIYYKEYDRLRYQNDPRVRARHQRYASTERGKEAIARAKKNWAERNR